MAMPVAIPPSRVHVERARRRLPDQAEAVASCRRRSRSRGGGAPSVHDLVRDPFAPSGDGLTRLPSLGRAPVARRSRHVQVDRGRRTTSSAPVRAAPVAPPTPLRSVAASRRARPRRLDRQRGDRPRRAQSEAPRARRGCAGSSALQPARGTARGRRHGVRLRHRPRPDRLLTWTLHLEHRRGASGDRADSSSEATPAGSAEGAR